MAADEKHILEGKQAPAFLIPDENSEEVSLEYFKGRWVVLYFYPKDNTPGCTIEAKDFSSYKQEFERFNTVILGVSPDSAESHTKFIRGKDLTITLLSDEHKKSMKEYHTWGKKKFMGKEYMGINRMSFLIDSNGKIAKIYDKVKPAEHAQEVLNDVRELSK